MPDPIRVRTVFFSTSSWSIDLFTVTQPRLVALTESVRTLWQGRGRDRVPPEIEADAQKLLHATRRIVARERGARPLLHLRPATDWATLLAKLELAIEAIAAFRGRYSGYDADYGDVVWRDELWRVFHGPAISLPPDDDESGNENNSLNES